VSEVTYERLNVPFVFEERGELDIKGKGAMKTYFLRGKR
jgi:adenylate cyclase